MKDNTVPGVYLLNIDMGCEQAKEEFKRMGFTDGEKLDFERFTPQALSVTPLWLVWHGTIHNGNMLLKSDEELIPLGISSKTELSIRRLSELVWEHSQRTGRYRDGTENGDYSLERLCRFERTSEKCMAAVRQDGWELVHVPEEVKTPEMCRLALDNSADLAYENLELLHYVPFPDICLEYIKANNGCGDVELPEVLSALAPGVIDSRIADYAIEQDGRCLGVLPAHLQTVERAEKAVNEAGTEALAGEKVRAELKTERLYRKCAEHSWMSFALLPKAERSPEICLLAAKLYPQETAQRPDLIPESVKNGCNVYSLCKIMEARTGEKFTYQQMTDFYNGKPLNVRRMEMPDGVQKDKAVKFDKEKQEFSFSAIRQERKRGLRM